MLYPVVFSIEEARHVLSVRRAPLIERTPLGAAYWRLQPEPCEKVGLGFPIVGPAIVAGPCRAPAQPPARPDGLRLWRSVTGLRSAPWTTPRGSYPV
jgi:hypothetical protein